jgi:hypothetical protein
VAEWATWTGYSDAERIAIEFAERFEGDVAACDDAFFERLAEHFDEGLIRDLTFCIGGWLGMGRITRVLDRSVACPVH